MHTIPVRGGVCGDPAAWAASVPLKFSGSEITTLSGATLSINCISILVRNSMEYASSDRTEYKFQICLVLAWSLDIHGPYNP